MKIQIDTIKKVVRVEEQVSLSELFDALNKLFPNEEWKEYKIDTNTIINWSNPIIIDRYRPTWWELWPYNQPIYTTGGTATQLPKQTEVYCLSIE